MEFKDCTIDDVAFAGWFGIIPVGFCMDCWNSVRTLVSDDFELPNNPENFNDQADAEQNKVIREMIDSLAESKTLPNNPENFNDLAPVSISQVKIDRDAELKSEQNHIAAAAKQHYLKTYQL
jgi:hypothetical protein